MTVEEYFGDWVNVLDMKELNNVMCQLRVEYQRKKICPAQPDVFKAFRLCSLKNLKIVMLLQDP